jgi:hypothetical protein
VFYSMLLDVKFFKLIIGTIEGFGNYRPTEVSVVSGLPFNLARSKANVARPSLPELPTPHCSRCAVDPGTGQLQDTLPCRKSLGS